MAAYQRYPSWPGVDPYGSAAGFGNDQDPMALRRRREAEAEAALDAVVQSSFYQAQSRLDTPRGNLGGSATGDSLQDELLAVFRGGQGNSAPGVGPLAYQQGESLAEIPKIPQFDYAPAAGASTLPGVRPAAQAAGPQGVAASPPAGQTFAEALEAARAWARDNPVAAYSLRQWEAQRGLVPTVDALTAPGGLPGTSTDAERHYFVADTVNWPPADWVPHDGGFEIVPQPSALERLREIQNDIAAWIGDLPAGLAAVLPEILDDLRRSIPELPLQTVGVARDMAQGTLDLIDLAADWSADRLHVPDWMHDRDAPFVTLPGVSLGETLASNIFREAAQWNPFGGFFRKAANEVGGLFRRNAAETVGPVLHHSNEVVPSGIAGGANAGAPWRSGGTVGGGNATAGPAATSTVTIPPVRLYHYTNEKGMEGIIGSNSLNPSLRASNPNDVRYGEGQYLTNIAPGSLTPGQMSRALIGNPWQGRRFTNFLEIDTSGLNVVQGRAGVYVIPNQTPLDLTGRIVSSGGVQAP